MMRKIISIDEEKCNGCGLCVTACAEGAIALVGGKARLVSESYCDGLGACLGGCPQGAITVEEREAAVFDETAVQRHLAESGAGAPEPSRLANWPVQLTLAPVQAPCYQGASLLLAADCVPCAAGDFHQRLLAGRTLLLGCPKLDDLTRYVEKLTAIIRDNDVQGLEVAYMEVPCCSALTRAAATALEASGKRIPLTLRKVTVRGEHG